MSLFFCELGFAQNTYYVSSSVGSDSNTGLSINDPIKSLFRINELAANLSIQPGDKILLRSGDTWLGEYLFFGSGFSIAADDTTEISSYGEGGYPILDGTITVYPDSAQSIGIQIETPNFKISKIEITHFTKDGIHSQYGYKKLLNLSIDSVYIHHTGSDLFAYVYGIYAEGKNIKVFNSYITETYNDGLFLLGANCEMAYCQIINAGSGPVGDALQIKYADNFWIHDNVMISDDLDHGIAITKQREGEPEFIGGIFERNYCQGNLWGFDFGGYGSIVRYNKFISNRAYAVKIRGHFAKVYDNYIYNTEQGIALGEPWVKGFTGYAEIYNNTIINTSEYAILLSDFDDSVYVSVANNIFSDINGYVLKKARKVSFADNIFDYNLYFSDSLPAVFIYDQDTIYSFNDWVQVSGVDSHSINSDPLILGEYCLSDYSPAIEHGLNLTFLNKYEYLLDIDNKKRSLTGNWDIGACENFTSPLGIFNLDNASTEKNVSRESQLFPIFPNPFNPTTHFSFELKSSSNVKIKIFDALGRLISILLDEELNKGLYTFTFDGSELTSGVYFYQFDLGNTSKFGKMILQK